MYRDRVLPYAFSGRDLEYADYYRHRSPMEWWEDEQAVSRYLDIYSSGDVQLRQKILNKLNSAGLVCENHDPVWVAGPHWMTGLGVTIWEDTRDLVTGGPILSAPGLSAGEQKIYDLLTSTAREVLDISERLKKAGI